MINYKFIDFDIKLIKLKIKQIFNNANILSIDMLNNLKQYFNSILIEYPYRDIEFSSVYSIYYSKKFKNIDKNAMRLHFFKKNIYGGYVIITDSPMESIGRGVFNINIIAPKGFYVLEIDQKVNFLGEKYKTPSFPWMMQDTDVDVCAHVALWSLNTYFANKFPYYKYFTIGEIATFTPNYIGRNIPSEGLNILQISDLMIKMGYYPVVLFKDELKEDFYNTLYSYLESGFPILVGMNEKQHAITLMGHGPISNLIPSNKKIVYNSELISSYLAVDDNYIPFTIIGEGGKYKLEDVDYFLVPLPEKVFLNVTHVYKETEKLIEKMNIKAQIIVRIYLTTIRNFKEYIKKQNNLAMLAKEILLRMETSRFIWVADIYDKSRNIISKIIFDATAGEYEEEKWICKIWNNEISLKNSNNQISDYKVNSINLPEFNHNLKEIR